MPERGYVVAIDQGTTGTTVLILDRRLSVKARENREFRQIFPKPGWVEHSLDDIWGSVTAALDQALRHSGVPGSEIAAVGITNQRETTCLWDRKSGRGVHNAIVWQDRRTAEACAALKAAGREPLFRERTGLVLDPYFSGTKLRWLLDEVKGARERAAAGDLCFGTIDSYLVHRLTGAAVHATDVTNASRTLLFDIRKLAWDPELCKLLDVPPAVLPKVCASSETIGQTKGLGLLPDGIPIAGIAGDQQAALFGQACFAPGESKCTYGTGAFFLLNTGAKPAASKHGLLTTVAWRVGGEVAYALEGSAFVAGAAVQWLRDGLGIIESAAEIEPLARKVKDSGGVVFVPALAGLGAPWWRPDARGLICGLDRGTTAAHLARATLEGLALQIGDLATSMEQDSGQKLAALRVDGGASQNNLLMQLQADVLGVPVERPRMIESTALGAAFLAGLAVGVWKSRDELRKAHKLEKRFTPKMDPGAREAMLSRWKRAVERA
ncbi:MAG TPA: glycerol kinase GlpK [Myxococcales bacterium]|nr:glycerol kinase GlpK [Myxococcales bacterium]